MYTKLKLKEVEEGIETWMISGWKWFFTREAEQLERNTQYIMENPVSRRESWEFTPLVIVQIVFHVWFFNLIE